MKIEKNIGKKAEVSSTTIITVILLVIGFVILLYFLLSILLNPNVDFNACHQSVVLRGTVPSILGAQSLVPLKCRTEKVCITGKFYGQECESFKGTKGVTRIKVSGSDTKKAKEQIERAVASKVVDCWNMMGEGKLSIFSEWIAETYGYGMIYPSCVVCSRIALDTKNLPLSEEDLKNLDFDKYMRYHLISNTNVTYQQYLGGNIKTDDNLFSAAIKSGAVDTQEPNELTEEQKKQNAEIEQSAKQADSGSSINTQREIDYKREDMAIMFMQISAPSAGNALGNLLTSAGGVFLGIAKDNLEILNPGKYISVYKTTTSGGKTFSPSLTKSGKVAFGAAIIALAVQQGYVYINRGISATVCGDLVTGGQERDGCSGIRLVPYNEKEMESYCPYPEFIP